MVTSAKMFLTVIFWDKKRGDESSISFEIKEQDDIKPIIKALKSKRLRILAYSVEIRQEV